MRQRLGDVRRQMIGTVRVLRAVMPDEVLIREGDVGDRYYVLESGRVRISSQSADRRIAQGPGYGFGEIALLRDIRRTATVTAVDPCVVLALERGDFLAAVTGHEQTRALVDHEVAERLAADEQAEAELRS